MASQVRMVGTVVDLHRRAAVAFEELALVGAWRTVQSDVHDIRHGGAIVPPK